MASVPATSLRAASRKALGWSALFFSALDKVLKIVLWPKGLRARAVEKCRSWVTERLNGEDGLGAIYPAMANSVMMYDVLGYAPDHPDRAIARKSVENLLVIKADEAYCQPPVSPRCGTPRLMLQWRCWKPNESTTPAEQAAACGTGMAGNHCRYWTSKATGRRKGPKCPRCGRAAGAFQYRNDHYPEPGRYRRGSDGDGR